MNHFLGYLGSRLIGKMSKFYQNQQILSFILIFAIFNEEAE